MGDEREQNRKIIGRAREATWNGLRGGHSLAGEVAENSQGVPGVVWPWGVSFIAAGPHLHGWRRPVADERFRVVESLW